MSMLCCAVLSCCCFKLSPGKAASPSDAEDAVASATRGNTADLQLLKTAAPSTGLLMMSGCCAKLES